LFDLFDGFKKQTADGQTGIVLGELTFDSSDPTKAAGWLAAGWPSRKTDSTSE
jgi:hypothetical protein